LTTFEELSNLIHYQKILTNWPNSLIIDGKGVGFFWGLLSKLRFELLAKKLGEIMEPHSDEKTTFNEQI